MKIYLFKLGNYKITDNPDIMWIDSNPIIVSEDVTNKTDEEIQTRLSELKKQFDIK